MKVWEMHELLLTMDSGAEVFVNVGMGPVCYEVVEVVQLVVETVAIDGGKDCLTVVCESAVDGPVGVVLRLCHGDF